MTTDPTPSGEEERAPREPAWVRVCQWYFLAMVAFGLLSSFLPESVRATRVNRPVGLAMLLLLAFATPVTLASTDRDPMTPRGRAVYGVFMVVVFALTVMVATMGPKVGESPPTNQTQPAYKEK